MSAEVPDDILTAGISSMRPAYDFALGIELKTSLLTVVCRLTLWTSTTGVTPDTVTVSSMVPTFSSAFTVAVNEPVSSMSCRLSELNPVNVKVTA
jgi:hypothetical protein